MIRKIIIPKYIFNGVKSSKVNIQKDINVLSSDIETKPYFRLGFYCKKNNEDVYKIRDITDVNNRFSIFLKELDNLTSSKKYNIVFFHNLKFDMQILLLEFKEYFYDSKFTLYFDRTEYKQITIEEYKRETSNRIKIDIFCGSTWFTKIYYGNSRTKSRFKKKVHILDSFAYFKKSLYDLSYDLNLEHKKYKIDFDDSTMSVENLEKYLRNDLLTQYDLSNFIIDIHRKYNVRMTVSIAQLSAQIFRKKFMLEDDNLPQIPSFFMNFAIKSYHGGKNGFYSVDKKVMKLKDMKEYDVNSMYPYAMSQIPNFLNCEYKLVHELDSKYEGIYCINGNLKKSKYPIFYTHDFKAIYGGKIKNLWVTSYELKIAIKTKVFKLLNCFGLLVIPNSIRNPLKDYVNYFYGKKNITPKKEPLYLFFKTLLNSLYGKFIQNVKDNKTLSFIFDGINLKKKAIVGKAGGLFQPLIASLITGFSRAFMYKLELKTDSLHTATDSVLTKKIIKTSKNLGGVSLQNQGDIIIFRNKCYILFGEKLKYAIHGFRGNIKDLLRIYITKDIEYSYSRFVNIRESLKRVSKPIIPCEWNNFESKLKINW